MSEKAEGLAMHVMDRANDLLGSIRPSHCVTADQVKEMVIELISAAHNWGYGKGYDAAADFAMGQLDSLKEAAQDGLKGIPEHWLS